MAPLQWLPGTSGVVLNSKYLWRFLYLQENCWPKLTNQIPYMPVWEVAKAKSQLTHSSESVRRGIHLVLCSVSAGSPNLDLRVEVHPPWATITKTHPHVSDITSMFTCVNVVRWCPTCLRRVWSTAPSAMRSTSTFSPPSTSWSLWWVTWTSGDRFRYGWMVQTSMTQWGLSQIKGISFSALL